MRPLAPLLALVLTACAGSAPALDQFHDDPRRIADAVELACKVAPRPLPDDVELACESLPAAIRVSVDAGEDVSEYVKRAKALLREVK